MKWKTGNSNDTTLLMLGLECYPSLFRGSETFVLGAGRVINRPALAYSLTLAASSTPCHESFVARTPRWWRWNWSCSEVDVGNGSDAGLLDGSAGFEGHGNTVPTVDAHCAMADESLGWFGSAIIACAVVDARWSCYGNLLFHFEGETPTTEGYIASLILQASSLFWAISRPRSHSRWDLWTHMMTLHGLGHRGAVTTGRSLSPTSKMGIDRLFTESQFLNV